MQGGKDKSDSSAIACCGLVALIVAGYVLGAHHLLHVFMSFDKLSLDFLTSLFIPVCGFGHVLRLSWMADTGEGNCGLTV